MSSDEVNETHLEGRTKLFQIGQFPLSFHLCHSLALFQDLLLFMLDEPLDVALDRLGSSRGTTLPSEMSRNESGQGDCEMGALSGGPYSPS